MFNMTPTVGKLVQHVSHECLRNHDYDLKRWQKKREDEGYEASMN